MRRPLTATIVLLAVALVAVAAPAGAAERTGEILRNLLEGVAADFETLEKETSRFATRAAQLNRTLHDKQRAFGAEADLGKRHVLRAEMYGAAAELNQQDRREIQITLRAISDVREKLGRIRNVLEQSGIAPKREERERFYQHLGRFAQGSAGLIDAWSRRAGPEAQADIAALKASLVGVVNSWEDPKGRGGSGDEELQRTVRTLDVMYSQMLTLHKGLEYEKTQLQLRNEKALLDLIVLKLTNGSTNVQSLAEAIGAKQEAVHKRAGILDEVEAGVASPSKTGRGGSLHGDTAAGFERIHQGRFQFGGMR